MNKDDSGDAFNKSATSDKYTSMRKYVEQSLLGFQQLSLKNFKAARKAYKICVEIAQQFEDEEIKLVESLLNYGVTLYFCGKFAETKQNLEDAFKKSSRILNSDYTNVAVQK